MGLFGSKKKKEDGERGELRVPIPSAPSAPSGIIQPIQKQEISEIKEAVKPEQLKFGQIKPIIPLPIIMPIDEKKQVKESIEKPFLQPIKLPMLSLSPMTVGIDEEEAEKPQKEKFEKPFIREIARPEKSRIGMRGPVYVKIDNYKEALQNFDEIKKKLADSFELLSKISEIRNKEREEIEEWEKEVDEIKEKLDVIEKNLFEKAE